MRRTTWSAAPSRPAPSSRRGRPGRCVSGGAGSTSSTPTSSGASPLRRRLRRLLRGALRGLLDRLLGGFAVAVAFDGRAGHARVALLGGAGLGERRFERSDEVEHL